MQNNSKSWAQMCVLQSKCVWFWMERKCPTTAILSLNGTRKIFIFHPSPLNLFYVLFLCQSKCISEPCKLVTCFSRMLCWTPNFKSLDGKCTCICRPGSLQEPNLSRQKGWPGVPASHMVQSNGRSNVFRANDDTLHLSAGLHRQPQKSAKKPNNIS